MKPPHKPDPYDGFRCDRERRRALNTRVRWFSAATAVVALTHAQMIDLAGMVRWLMTVFR